MSPLILFLRIFLTFHASQAPAPASVTYLDLSGPSAPESEFPTISHKGAL